MKKILLLILIVVFLCSVAPADNFDSLNQVNSINWAKYFSNLLGYMYYTHGCLHFSPSDIYLLCKTVPKGIPLKIKTYKDNEPPFVADLVPYFNEITNYSEDIEKHIKIINSGKTEIWVYPALDMLYIIVDGGPYAKVKMLAGLPYEYLMAFDVENGKPITWDFMVSTPTDPGNYEILESTDHYISNAYYKTTIIPFGAWMVKKNNSWEFQKGNNWYQVPDYIVTDLNLPEQERNYKYYDVAAQSVRWAAHDFGKYALLWTKDGITRYPELGYAAGDLVYEQIMLVKDIVYILTLDGPDDLDYCVSQNKNFSYYRELYNFVSSNGKYAPSRLPQKFVSYYRLFYGLQMDQRDYDIIDPQIIKAFNEYNENRMPRSRDARLKTLGLYQYLSYNCQIIKKQAYWYQKLLDDWENLKKLKAAVKADFPKMGILSIENRQNLLEYWLTRRLEFKKAEIPAGAKYLQTLSFSAFFNPNEQISVFTQREKKVMKDLLAKTVQGQDTGLNLKSVDALNNYNFGRLLNEILGDLYKSHGCMHVSPRNSYFLYETLPIGATIKVYPYTSSISAEAIKKIPFLSDLVNYKEDLENLKTKFSKPSDVNIEVYPASGIWILNLSRNPFAQLNVKGGPQTKMYTVLARDSNEVPIFEEHMAYPTSSGNFYTYKKIKDYISNIYYDTTIIPMDGKIKKEKGAWIFQNKKGDWQAVPDVIAQDLNNPEDKRSYTYYDIVKNSNGETVELKWGSNTFGKYIVQITENRRAPSPEIIHTSGDLMMEERQIIDDLIKILSAPFDDMQQCIKYGQNSDISYLCYQFACDPTREDLIDSKNGAFYKLYFGLPLSTVEASLLPPDAIIADKVLKGKKLNNHEISILNKEGIASNGKINMEKIMGIEYDSYLYVVSIQKLANRYAVLKNHWGELSELRGALLSDFNEFVLEDPKLFQNFMRELMLRRTRLEKLNQADALKTLNDMVNCSL